jgi:hypothetical protein
LAEFASRKEKNRGDEPIQAIIHIYTEMYKCIAFLNKQKCLFFETENRKIKYVLSGEVGTNGRGEDIKKGYIRVSMVEIVCSHV